MFLDGLLECVVGPGDRVVGNQCRNVVIDDHTHSKKTSLSVQPFHRALAPKFSDTGRSAETSDTIYAAIGAVLDGAGAAPSC